MDAFIFAIAFLVVFLLIRNAIVLRACIAAAAVLHDLCGTGEFNVEFRNVESMGYTSMMFDLTKWTFKQFYPSLAERLQSPR